MRRRSADTRLPTAGSPIRECPALPLQRRARHAELEPRCPKAWSPDPQALIEVAAAVDTVSSHALERWDLVVEPYESMGASTTSRPRPPRYRHSLSTSLLSSASGPRWRHTGSPLLRGRSRRGRPTDIGRCSSPHTIAVSVSIATPGSRCRGSPELTRCRRTRGRGDGSLSCGPSGSPGRGHLRARPPDRRSVASLAQGPIAPQGRSPAKRRRRPSAAGPGDHGASAR